MRLCAEAGCASVATYRGRCRQHARTNDQAIARKGAGKYGTRLWRRRRAQQLFREPLCAHCGHIAEIAHHVDGIENDPHHRRLQSLCTSCHSALHRKGPSGGRPTDASNRRMSDGARKPEIPNE